jgi:glutamine amidotransferase
MTTGTVAVVDYGMGNLRSVSQAVMHAAQGSGVAVHITQRPEDVLAADRIVLPGQGAMRDCMRELRDSGMLEAVLDAAARKPVLGVCIGMQMLLDHSEEQDTPGLGLIPGRVLRFPSRRAPPGRRQPLQGAANGLEPCAPGTAARALGGYSRRELVLLRPQLPRRRRTRTTAPDHRLRRRFTSAVARDNIFATQFHPEKSADLGLALYRNFLHWMP